MALCGSAGTIVNENQLAFLDYGSAQGYPLGRIFCCDQMSRPALCASAHFFHRNPVENVHRVGYGAIKSSKA
jgi:hypothetical protein